MDTSRFDRAAATWDENPVRVALTRGIVTALGAQVPVRPDMTAVDYGCGTGLVTLALQPAVRRTVGADSSPGMLAKLQEKVAALGIANVETCLLDLTAEPPPADLRADLIVSAMTLHHIPDVPRLLMALGMWLRPGGWLALADLDAEDGSFHADPTGVYHHGFDRDWLTAQLAAQGYHTLRATTAHVVRRPDATGALRDYPVFLVSGCKGASQRSSHTRSFQPAEEVLHQENFSL